MNNEYFGFDLTESPPSGANGNAVSMDNGCAQQVVRMAYVPMQRLGKVYEPEQGFDIGTIFPELNKPFLAGGRDHG